MEVLKDAVLALHAEGTTVIFSTHDMDIAERMCDTIFMIFRGKKVLDDTLEAIQASVRPGRDPAADGREQRLVRRRARRA